MQTQKSSILRKILICALSCSALWALNQDSAEQATQATKEVESVNVATIPQGTDISPLNNQHVIELEAVGIGVAPQESCTPAQAVAMAKRAAIVDAYRQLGEQMYGIQLNSNDSVRNMVLQNSTIKTRLNALIRGAQIKETSCQQGVCQVNMELRLDGRVWSKVLGISL